MKKVLSLVLVTLIILGSCFGLAACSNKSSQPITYPTLSSIEEINIIDTICILTWTDNTVTEIQATKEMITGFDTSTAGEKTLTITLDDKTCKFNYSVYDYSDVRLVAKEKIIKHIDKFIDEDYYISKEEVNSVRNSFFEKIDTHTNSFNDIAIKATVIIDLIVLEDEYAFLISLIHALYDTPISDCSNIIENIYLLGYYTGSQSDYDYEISNINKEQQEAYILYEKEKKYMNQSGMTLSQIELKYHNTYNALQLEKQSIQILWERRIDLIDTLQMKATYENGRDNALILQELDYNQKKNLLNSKLLQFGELQ